MVIVMSKYTIHSPFYITYYTMENICNLLTAPCTKYKAFKTSNKFFSCLAILFII